MAFVESSFSFNYFSLLGIRYFTANEVLPWINKDYLSSPICRRQINDKGLYLRDTYTRPLIHAEISHRQKCFGRLVFTDTFLTATLLPV